MQRLVTQVREMLGPLDSRLLSLISLAILLIIILTSFMISSVGSLFLISLLLITAYLSSNLTQR